MKKLFLIAMLMPMMGFSQAVTFKGLDTNFFLWSISGNYVRFNPLGRGATNWPMLNVTGRVTAGSFYGDGSGLTGLPSGTNVTLAATNAGDIFNLVSTTNLGVVTHTLTFNTNLISTASVLALLGASNTVYQAQISVLSSNISVGTNNFNELMHKFKVAPTLNDLVITNFANRLNTATNALRIAYFGDSMTAPDTGGAIDGFITNLVQLHGRSGGLVANYPHYYYEFAGGSATIAPNTNWWSNHIFLTNGATINWRAGQVNGPTNGGVNNGANVWADSAAVYFLNQSGAGTFTISISTNGGAYGVVATINANATRAGVVTNFSLPLGYYQLKLTGTAGTNTIIDAGLWVENHRVVAPVSISSSGYTYNDWAAVSTNVTWPIFSFWSPDVILMEAKDTAAIFTNAFPQLERMFTNCVPDMDAVYMGTTPQQLEGDNITNTIPQNAAMRELAETYNRFYWDTYTLFRSYTNATALGFTSGDGTHFNSEGGIFKGRLLWAEVFRNVLILSSLNPIVSAGANVIVTPSTNVLTGQITYSVASSGGGLSTNDFDTNYFTWTGTNFVFNTNRFFAGDIPVYVEGLTNGFTIVTNVNGTRTWTVFYKTNYSTSAGLETNSITGAHFRQTNSVVSAATNQLIDLSTGTYFPVTGTNDGNFIFTNLGAAMVRFARNGTNRLITLTTNAIYTSPTNIFTTLGNKHSLTLTNAHVFISVYRPSDSDTNMTVNVAFSNPAEAVVEATVTNLSFTVSGSNAPVTGLGHFTFDGEAATYHQPTNLTANLLEWTAHPTNKFTTDAESQLITNAFHAADNTYSNSIIASNLALAIAHSNSIIASNIAYANTQDVAYSNSIVGMIGSGSSFDPTNLFAVAKNGNDSNDGYLNSPKLTLNAAVGALFTYRDGGEAAGSILVYPGIYDEAIDDSPYNRLHFQNGASVDLTAAENFLTVSSEGAAAFTGDGEFLLDYDYGLEGGTNALFINDGGRLLLNAVSVSTTDSEGLVDAIYHKGGTSHINVSSNLYGYWTALHKKHGELHVNVTGSILGHDADGYFGYWSDSDSTGNSWITCKRMGRVLKEGTATSVTWITAQTIEGQTLQHGGKLYVTAMKSVKDSSAASPNISVTGGLYWGNIQKLSPTVGELVRIDHQGGSEPINFRLQFLDNEDTEPTRSTYWLDIANLTNSVVSISGHSWTNSAGTNAANGMRIGYSNVVVQIDTVDMRPNTNASALTITASGATIKDSRFLVDASVPSVTATNTQTLNIDGTLSVNTDPHSNVRFTGGKLVVTAGTNASAPTIYAPWGSTYQKAGATNFWFKDSGSQTNIGWTAK